MQEPSIETLEFLDFYEVSRRVGLARTTIYGLIRRGSFPAPAKLGTRASRWSAGEIAAWMRERLAERDCAT